MRSSAALMRASCALLASFVLAGSGACHPAAGTEYKIHGKGASEVFSRQIDASLANAACLGDSMGVRQALSSGANPNAVGLIGQQRTPLISAFELGNSEGFWDNYYALLDNGVNINFVWRGVTIAEHQSIYNRFDKVFELLDRGYCVRLLELAKWLDEPRLTDAQIEQREWALKSAQRLKGIKECS